MEELKNILEELRKKAKEELTTDKELHNDIEKLIETAEAVRQIYEENGEETLSQVLKDEDIVKEIIEKIKKIEKEEQKINEEVKRLTKKMREIIEKSGNMFNLHKKD